MTRLPGAQWRARRAGDDEPGLEHLPDGRVHAFRIPAMTLFVAVMLGTFPVTRWPVNVVGVTPTKKSEAEE